MDTIFALATANGRAGVAIVRVSGPEAFDICSSIAGTLPPPRQAGLRRIENHKGELLDEALVLVFEAPNSFTGENTVELHLHGSPAIVQSVTSALEESNGRIAEPGEFSRRALENDRMDLVQVEALGDLLMAETEAQRRQAMKGYDGEFSNAVNSWRKSLVRAASLIEVTIDFADEEVPVDVTPEVRELIDTVRKSIQRELSGFSSAERVRNGFEVAIIGKPNTGKSTVLNAIARRDAAITSEIEGTTRDVIEVRMDIGGLPVTFLDTAGLRETDDAIERQGIKRALERAKSADLRVFLVSSNETLPIDPVPEDIVLVSKSDLLSNPVKSSISGKTGEGVDQLLTNITKILREKHKEAGLVTKERQRVALTRSVNMLDAAEENLRLGPAYYELTAEELRASTRMLETVIGKIGVEDILDEIFSSFCLGK